MSLVPDELYCAFVVSTQAHATLVGVDPSAALCMPGVVDYVCHKDVPGDNKTGSIIKDEEVFATNTVRTIHAIYNSSYYNMTKM